MDAKQAELDAKQAELDTMNKVSSGPIVSVCLRR